MTRTFKILPIVVAITVSWGVHAQQVAYSPTMLRALVPEGQDIDISFFEKGFDIPPGVYNFTVYFNGDVYSATNVELREYDGTIEPFFSVNDIRQLPIKESVLSRLSEFDFDSDDGKFPIYEILKGATAKVNSQKMRIDISVPQIYLASNNGWVDVADPELWDYGETAAVINYNLSGNHLKSREVDYQSSYFYGNMSARLNFGAWRLYSSGSFSYNKSKSPGHSQSSNNWDLWNTYLQRDIPQWKSTLQIGELNTSGEIFDTIPIRGLKLASNEQMLPYKDRSYSPIIEGVANTNAQIIIRQNGHIVHTLNVAPGPFRLDDLPNFGSYGDLEVVIRESDGSERIINVPYSSVPNMLREGQYRYDANVGRFYYKNQPDNVENPFLFMGTLQYGLPYDMTVYGGTLLSENYYALALGTGVSLGAYGAMAADVIQSNYRKDEQRFLDSNGRGAAWRVRYEKTMTNTGTTVNIANYQYISGQYASFQDYVEYGSIASSGLISSGNLKSRWQISLSQSLGQWGNLYLGGDYAKYSGDSSDVKTLNAGYHTSIKGVGVSLNYSRNYYQVGSYRDKHWDSNHTVMLNLSIPLSLFYRNSSFDLINSTSLSYMGRMQKTAQGQENYSHSVVMTGSTSDPDISWTLAQDLGGNEDRATSLSVGYTGDRITASAGVDHNKYTNAYQMGLNGAVVLHKTGITLASNAHDSIAVIEVPDAAGVKVAQNFETKTDMFGHAVLTYLTNYTKNEFAIDSSTLPDGALLLDNTNRIVIPAGGSVVRVKYPVRFGKQAVFVLRDENQRPVSFGSKVDLFDEDGKKDPFVSGIVGEGGRVYLSGLPSKGILKVDTSGYPKLFSYVIESNANDFQDNGITIPTISLQPELSNISEK